MLDWNDLRYFLAVAREGSTLAAGRALRVSQTTVARRTAALEEAIGFPLFDKRQAGYVLTPAGEELVPVAVRVECEAQQFADAAAAHSRNLTGTVRITSEDIYGTGLLSPLLRDLHDLHPKIMIDLDMVQETRDLGSGEADIALEERFGARWTDLSPLPAKLVRTPTSPPFTGHGRVGGRPLGSCSAI
jgi:DNA-binding transcriptional LysR family regulator